MEEAVVCVQQLVISENMEVIR